MSTTAGRLSREPRLEGKVCYISGASRGFGQAIAVRFVEEGAQVVIFSRGGCAETMELIDAIEGVTADDVALSCKCDISNEESLQEMYVHVFWCTFVLLQSVLFEDANVVDCMYVCGMTIQLVSAAKEVCHATVSV